MALRIPGNNFAAEGIQRTVAKGMPNPAPVSMSWNLYIDNDRADYQAFIWLAPTATFTAADYYGPSAILAGGAQPPVFALSAHGQDKTGDAETPNYIGRWLRQCWRCWRTATTFEMEYYYDLPNFTKVLRAADLVTPPTNTYYPSNPAGNAITIGHSPWTVNEGLNGRITNLKLWQAALPLHALVRETYAREIVHREYRPALWCHLKLPHHGDLQDYSGNGRHFVQTGDPISTIADPPFLWSRQPSILQAQPAAGAAAAASRRLLLLGVGN